MDDDTEITGRFEVEGADIGWMLLDPLGELVFTFTDRKEADAAAFENNHRLWPAEFHWSPRPEGAETIILVATSVAPTRNVAP